MAVRHKHRNWLATFPETTVCQAPASWADDGLPLLHTSIDISGIKSTFVEDPTLEVFGQAVGTRDVHEGARSVEFKFSTNLYGLGVVPAQDAQAATNPMLDLIERALGGSSYSNTTEVTGGTSAAVTVDDATNFQVGQLAAFEDTTSPTKAGQIHWRRISAIDTLTLTLSEKLPFTPAAGDNVYGCGTFFIRETILEDAVANLKTNAWFIQSHPTDPHFTWEVTGAVHSIALSGIERNSPAKIEFDVMGGNYRHSDEDGLANVAFAEDPFGFPPNAISQMKCSISLVSDDEHNVLSISSFSVDLGISRSPVDTITEVIDRFEGRHSYSVAFKPSEITIVLPEYDAAWYASLKTKAHYRLSLYEGSKGAGKSWCIHFPDCQLTETPAKNEIGEVMGVQLKFRATPNSAGATDLIVSRVLLGFA
jgi:hypothetical protein